MSAPSYWMHETGGVLRPAIEAYLHDEPLSPTHIAAIRAYLRQWIFADGWLPNEEIEDLRLAVDGLTSRDRIDSWLESAVEIGIDPL